MTGNKKTVLITGSTDGIGLSTASGLITRGYHVILHGRNEDRIAQAIEKLDTQYGTAPADTVAFDLSSLASVQEGAEDILSRYTTLDVLLNNAGVFMGNRVVSKDGFEMTLAVNHIGHFALTMALQSLLKQRESKIVNVSSMVHASRYTPEVFTSRSHDGYETYSQSKLFNLLFTYALSRKSEQTGPSVIALHPGVISTKLLHAGWGGGSPPTEGASNLMRAVQHNGNGVYLMNGQETRSSPISYDTAIQDDLWDKSVSWTGLNWKNN